MKFNNGQWLLLEGYAAHAPQEVYFTKLSEDGTEFIITAPTSKIMHRGATLGGVLLTISISTPMNDVIRVKTVHHKGLKKRTPDFEITPGNNKVNYVETEENITFTSGNCQLVITKEHWSMTYSVNGKVVSSSSFRDLACIKADWKGDAYDKHEHDKTFMRQQLTLGVGTNVYGLGERFTSFVKNGQVVDIWNEDGGTSSEQSYKNIPFYITNKGYGVFVNHPEKVSFEVASEEVKKVGFSVKGEELDYFFIAGKDMKDVLVNYTSITGKPSLPAPWTFGLWLSTSFTTNYDEKTAMSFIDGMLDREIPLSVFHFDCFWMKDFHWSNFKWDERTFPDPEGMLKRIHDKGLKTCAWINPYIAQESEMFDEGVKGGYFIKRTNGDVYQWDMWQPGMAIVDFTNPAATKWFCEKLEVILDQGIDAIKTDFGERIPHEDVVYFDGSNPEKMHNFYTYQYNKAVFELLQRKRGKDDAVLFARSATVGGQKFPVHWGGDCYSDFPSMSESLRGGLSLQMSGFGYWSHDIGGFESTSTPDVYKRWCAFGLLSSHSRLHGSTSYRVPWAYDEESVDVVKFFTNLKLRLMPYLYKTAVDTSVTGIPTMRSMVLEYTNDITCLSIDKQYMLGDNLLVAPVFDENGDVDVYLPEGRWTNFFTGEVKDGGRWYKENHNYLSIPLYVKENTIVATGAIDNKPAYDYEKDVTLSIYELTSEVTTNVFGQDANEKLTVKAVKDGNKVTINVNANDNFKVRLVNVVAKSATNAELNIEGNNTILVPNGTKVEVTVEI